MSPNATATRRALVFIAAAFALTAVLVVLQTAVFQLLPWDSSALSAFSMALRFAFLLADVLLLVGFVTMGRAEATTRGLVMIGAVLAGYGVASGLTGIASRMAPRSPALRSISDTMSASEPVISLGAALLAVLVLGALPSDESRSGQSRDSRGHASRITIVVAVSLAMSLALRFSQLIDADARSVFAVWVSWTSEVVRPAAIAFLALGIVRSTRTSLAKETAAEGPYRAAGEGPLQPTVTTETPDAAAAMALRAAAAGLGFYRAVFLSRVALSVGMIFVLFIAALVGSDAAIALIALSPLSSLVTAVLITIGIVKLLALPRTMHARGPLIAALLAMALSAFADAGTIVAAAMAIASSGYRARDQLAEALAISWPLGAFAGGLSLVLIASTLRRVGEKIGATATVARARWVQGFGVATGAAQLAFVFALVASESGRGNPYSSAGRLVVVALFLAAIGSMIAAVVLHALLVAASHRALHAYADNAPG